MPPRQKSLTKGRWRAVALSVLLHAAIVAAAVYGWFTWKHKSPDVNTLAIQATVIDERALKNLAPPKPEPQPEPKPPEPEPEEQGPPAPDAAEVEKRKQEEQQKLEEQKKAEELKKADEQKAEQERLDNEKKEAEKQAAAKAAAEKAAAEKAAADKKAAEKKKAEEAAAAKKAAEEKARLAAQAELRRSMEAEERSTALMSSSEMAQWKAQIEAKIQRNWIKPPSAQAGFECIVRVQQVQGGEVTAVHVDSCTGGDAALRESVENAVYRASPLPTPSNPALFDRNLILTFKPPGE
jgi:colicin import membrane protein